METSLRISKSASSSPLHAAAMKGSGALKLSYGLQLDGLEIIII